MHREYSSSSRNVNESLVKYMGMLLIEDSHTYIFGMGGASSFPPSWVVKLNLELVQLKIDSIGDTDMVPSKKINFYNKTPGRCRTLH